MDNLSSGEPGQGTKQAQAKQKWRVCSLSGEPLKEPIVICELGKLYNRSSVVEFLLGEGIFVNNREELKKTGFGHIKSIKNVFEISMKRNPNATESSKKATKNSETTAQEKGLFMCPMTQLETNGMHQFSALKTCGHVFSEKALNMFQEQKLCWTCNMPYTKDDVIPINGNEKAVTELEERMKQRMERDEKEKKEKKDKKRKRKDEKEKKSEKRLALEGPEKHGDSTTTTTTTTTTTATTPTPTTTTATTATTATTIATTATTSTTEKSEANDHRSKSIEVQ